MRRLTLSTQIVRMADCPQIVRTSSAISEQMEALLRETERSAVPSRVGHLHLCITFFLKGSLIDQSLSTDSPINLSFSDDRWLLAATLFSLLQTDELASDRLLPSSCILRHLL